MSAAPTAEAPRLLGSPYKGLSAFGESDADALLFFGRERETEIVTANVLAARLTVLYGPSGVGKTSLLRAGVVHRLRELSAQSPLAVAAVSSWGGDPLAAIADAVRGAVTQAGVEAPAEGAGSLADLFGTWSDQLGGELCLILDQLEEYFLYHGDTGGLVDELPALVTRPGLRVNVLLGIREDELARLDAFKPHVPALFANSLRLDHLDRDAARAAIVGPLARHNELAPPAERVDLEPELVEAVLVGVAARRVERVLAGRRSTLVPGEAARVEAPFLQLVMQRLWEVEREAGSDTLRLETLESLGGARRIAADHLERALGQLSAGERDTAAEMFDHLVTPTGTKIALGLGDLARYAHAPEAAVRVVVAGLVGARVLRPVEPTGNGAAAAPRYEIFHDVLADPVLAWRTRHEAERALERERTEARRRHRRLAVLAGLALVGLALTAALAVYAFSQRAEADQQGQRAQARALRAESLGLLGVDPEGSAALAIRAAETDRSVETERALRLALMQMRARTILPGDSPIRALELSGDGALLLVATADGVARIYDPRDGLLVREHRHGAELTSAALGRDGRVVVTGGSDGSVKVWNAAGGPPLAFERGAPISSVAIDPRGRLVAASGGRIVRVWTLGDGTLRYARRATAPVERVAFSPDGATSMAVAKDAFVYDSLSGKRLAVLDQAGDINVAVFSPDSRRIGTGGRDDVASIWQARTGRLLVSHLGHPSDVRAFGFSPDASLVVTGSSDGSARIWRAQSGDLVSTLVAHTNSVEQVAFSPDGTTVATASLDGTAWIWGGRDYQLKAPLLGHAGGVTKVLFSPDGSSVFTGSEDGSARIWSAVVDPPLPILATHAGGAAAVAFDPGGQQLVTAGLDGTVQVVRVDGTPVVTLHHEPAVADATFSPDGRFLLTAGGDGSAWIWRTSDWARERTLAHGAPVRSAAFSSDGTKVVTAGADGIARIWSTSGRPILSIRHGSPLTAAGFSPDGAIVGTAGEDARGRLWRAGDGLLLRDLVGHEGPLTSIAFSPDGRTLATASVDADARLWNVATGRTRRVLTGHAAIVSGVSFSPDGRWLVTAGPMTAGLWEVETGRRLEPGRPLLYLRGHRPRVRDAAFGPDSRRIATTGDDGTIRMYRCRLCGTVDELVPFAQQRLRLLGRNLDASERARYLPAE